MRDVFERAGIVVLGSVVMRSNSLRPLVLSTDCGIFQIAHVKDLMRFWISFMMRV